MLCLNVNGLFFQELQTGCAMNSVPDGDRFLETRKPNLGDCSQGVGLLRVVQGSQAAALLTVFHQWARPDKAENSSELNQIAFRITG